MKKSALITFFAFIAAFITLLAREAISPTASPQTLPASVYNVVQVVDGDTIKVEIDGTKQTLRLIGINTPETVDPRKPVECFGREASNKAKELLANQNVKIVADPTQDERDKYDRLLRYVYLEDGTNFNKLMIEQGYAYEYTYDVPYQYQEDFKAAQRYAQQNKLGLWGATCSQN
ncbi:MAG: thermonuclease family protein [Patescibacteria group bacterium]